MLYREIIAVYSEIHTKHISTLCGRNVVFVNVKLLVRIVTTRNATLKVFLALTYTLLIMPAAIHQCLAEACPQTAGHTKCALHLCML
jgi:hypothetical protein